MLVLQLADLDRIPLAQVGPQVLRLATAVVGDHRVGRVENGLGRAVVLLQPDHVGVDEGLFELEDVADVGPTEPVHTLIRVAHHHQVAVLLAQQLEPLVLGRVRVLVLVDQDVLEPLGVALAYLVEQPQEVDGPEQEVIEVHRIHAVQLTLVLAIHVGHGLLEERPHHLPVGVSVAQAVLGVGDLRPDGRRCEPLGIHSQLVQTALDQPARVGLVIDRELPRVAQPVGMGAEHAGAGGVKGHHPHGPHPPADQQGDPVAHLARGLVGERDGQDLVGRRRPRGQQVGDPMGEHAGLA